MPIAKSAMNSAHDPKQNRRKFECDSSAIRLSHPSGVAVEDLPRKSSSQFAKLTCCHCCGVLNAHSGQWRRELNTIDMFEVPDRVLKIF